MVELYKLGQEQMAVRQGFGLTSSIEECSLSTSCIYDGVGSDALLLEHATFFHRQHS
jgi:hypothetical protein